MDSLQSNQGTVRIAVLGALMLVAIVLALWAAYQWYQPLRTSVDEARLTNALPEELKGAFIVELLESGAFGFHKIGELGFEFVPNPGRVPPGALSPDGLRGTNAVRLEGSEPSVSVDSSVWTVRVFSVEDGAVITSWSGYAPAFLDDVHVIYFDDLGISVRNIESGEVERLMERTADSRLGSVVQYAPDRSHVMWTDDAHDVSIVAKISTTSYEHKGVFAHPANLALFNGAVYELRPSAGGIELWRHELDGSSAGLVATLPDRLNAILLWP